MSWQNNLDNIVFTIKTGDGKTFTPLWKDSEKSKEYNTTVFDFIDVDKSFVERKKPKSGKYPLTFWFQGENCIELSQDFENSADNPRAWEITHPFYGTIKGQPLSLNRNDRNYNITEISIDFWESIGEDYPNDKISIIDETAKKNNIVNENAVVSYASNNVFSSQDISNNKQSDNLVNSSFENKIEGDDFADYQLIYSSSKKSNDNLLSDPQSAISNSQKLLSYPSTLSIPVKQKLKGYIEAYNVLSKTLNTISDKLFFESQGGACLSNYCNASVNYLYTDYEVRSDVEEVVASLIQIYNDYLLTLDSNSISIYNIGNTFQPDVDLQTSIYNIVMFTISNLYNLAFSAKQERTIYTKKDTNLIVLTHQYLGLDSSDENIEKFRQINNIKLDELFNVKKDRLIKYYV